MSWATADPRPGARLLVAYGEEPAHGLLRAQAAAFHDVDPGDIRLGHLCGRCGSIEHGRPVLLAGPALPRPAHVSLSRAGALSVVAVSGAGPVGVDIEAQGAADFDGFDGVALHPIELDAGADRTRAWVRKEAVLKARGTGLAQDPRSIRVDDAAPEADRAGVWLRDLPLAGYAVAVAVIPDEDVDTSGLNAAWGAAGS